jgi:hypothetical protein
MLLFHLYTSSERIKLTLQNQRLKNKELEARIETLQNEIRSSSIKVTNNLNSDLKSIMSNADPSKVSPFMQFFGNSKNISNRHLLVYDITQ